MWHTKFIVAKLIDNSHIHWGQDSETIQYQQNLRTREWNPLSHTISFFLIQIKCLTLLVFSLAPHKCNNNPHIYFLDFLPSFITDHPQQICYHFVTPDSNHARESLLETALLLVELTKKANFQLKQVVVQTFRLINTRGTID